MAEKEYIDREVLLEFLQTTYDIPLDQWMARNYWSKVVEIKQKFISCIEKIPAADVVEVIRCEDCKWFVPKHIRLDNGSTREYTEEEKKLPLGVPGNVGINCGSRCMRHISWLENSVPVWVQENDFCSYGERKEATP